MGKSGESVRGEDAVFGCACADGAAVVREV